MPSRLTIAIPTVPSRQEMAAGLAHRLADECPGAAIVSRCGGVTPSEDYPALIELALTLGRPWILAIEDDAWPAPDFGDRLAEVIDHADATAAGAVTLFSRRQADIDIMARGERWRTQAPRSLLMIQALLLCGSVVRGFCAWAPSWYAANPEHRHAADMLIGEWLALRRARLLVHVPSLVQHRAVPSTFRGRSRQRQSETYRIAFGEVPGE
jgi:hypothetical protein